MIRVSSEVKFPTLLQSSKRHLPDFALKEMKPSVAGLPPRLEDHRSRRAGLAEALDFLLPTVSIPS